MKHAGSQAKARRRKPDARVVVELSPADRTISPYARRVLGIFRKRVTEALQDFENRRIEVAVHAKNGMVRGVPRHEHGSIIVDEGRAVSTSTGARITERLEAKRDLPAYGLAEAAHYIRVPAATLRSWVLGRSYESREGKRQFAPLIRAADRHVPVLSFSNLLEAFVLRALRTEHGVPIKAVRSALRYAERELDVQQLLLNKQLCTTGGELFLDRYGQLVNLTRSGQLAMKAVLEAHLKRVEWSEDDVAVRLYPFVRGESAESPRVIAIDPLIAFGRPVVARRGVSTQAIVDRIDAGESLADVADDYEVSESEVEEAIVYQRAA